MKIAFTAILNSSGNKLDVLIRILPIFCILFLFSSTGQANPIDIRTQMAISEVYLESPTKWYIEMDIKKNGYWCNYPCSTSSFRLKMSSLKDTCNLRLYVNSAGIAVITPNSVRSLSPVKNDTISLRSSDSVFIFDTLKSPHCEWKFVLPQIRQGYSLINVMSGNPIQTDRITIGYRGNPPEGYYRPLISEVIYTNSKDWAMELDIQQTGIPQTLNPGSVIPRLRMQVSNSSLTYSFNARFDTNGIAVLRPGDIFSGTDTLKELTIPTTVKVLDTCWNSTFLNGMYWWFSIQETTDSAHTLINQGTRKTVRTSMGRRITYSTLHKVHFFDNAFKPLSGAFIYYPKLETNPYDPFGNSYLECLRLLKEEQGSSTSIGVDINSPVKWFAFTREPITSTCIEKSKYTGISWTGQYIDSLENANDTLVFPDIVAISIPLASDPKVPQKLIHVNSDRQKTLLTASLPAHVTDSYIKILALDGKLIAKLPLGPIFSTGTYSCIWKHGSSVPAGMYLCVLVADGVEVQTIKATIK